MKKIIKGLIIIMIFLTLGSSLAAFSIEENEYSNEEGLERVILIDPGHGGGDGGASSQNGTVEKVLNLEVSLKLKKVLEEKGYRVELTRENDEALSKKKRDDLWLRCKKKKETKCDVFISIHQNKFSNKKCKGSQLWHASNKESKNLALNIQASIKENLQNDNNRIPKDAKNGLFILKDGNKRANVILECGFISNDEDEENLKNEEYQNKLAEATANGIEKYYKEKNSN
ncbi:MAG: N-acetylmuramoyl-L-alanine amidase [Clostridium sp.]|uniref:N-acetylmuramoyl-L-alanine amidase n=1 Tax=Clostridium sp. TaxID=1506 RepID=UPI003F3DBC39